MDFGCQKSKYIGIITSTKKSGNRRGGLKVEVERDGRIKLKLKKKKN